MAEFDDILDLIYETEQNIGFTEDFLEKAEEVRIPARREMDRLEEAIERYKSPEYVDSLILEIIGSVKRNAFRFYRQGVEDAVAASPEYGYAAFLDPLLSIGDIEELYDIRPTGTGWGTSVIVNLRMNDIAGSLEDYARAVDLARQADDVTSKDPDRASQVWRSIYTHKPEKYADIIESRFAFLSEPAPFWSLLQHGNKSVSMSSDWGGTAYPDSPPTRFVDEIEGELVKWFSENKKSYKEAVTSKINETKTNVTRIQRGLVDLDQKVLEISQNFESAKNVSERFLTHETSDISPEKLRFYREQAEAGLLTGRVNIGVPGTRVRVSVSTLLALGD